MTAAAPPRAKPIIFSPPMVRALLEGRKTQTRRMPRTAQPVFYSRGPSRWVFRVNKHTTLSVYSPTDARRVVRNSSPYEVGDVLWVREMWQDVGDAFYYRATDEKKYAAVLGRNPWKPSIHMPRKACRLFLRVTDVRAHRVQEILANDIYAEGIPPSADETVYSRDPRRTTLAWNGPRGAFAALWDRLHGIGAWELDPWVLAYTFTVATKDPS